jgi:hypothetical protein
MVHACAVRVCTRMRDGGRRGGRVQGVDEAKSGAVDLAASRTESSTTASSGLPLVAIESHRRAAARFAGAAILLVDE